MRHQGEEKDSESMIIKDSIFRQQEYIVESSNREQGSGRNEWAGITRASVLSDDDDESSDPANTITGRVMLYAEDSLMQWNMCCVDEGRYLEDDNSDIEVNSIIGKSATFPSPSTEHKKSKNKDVLKIIDKESVEVSLDGASQSRTTKPKEIFYQEEVRDSVDDVTH